VEKNWESFIVTCGEVLGKKYSNMWRSTATALELHVEKCWDSSIVTCGEVLGDLYNYMWINIGRAV